MRHLADELDQLPLDALQKIDQLCERFEQEWNEGTPPSLCAFLDEAPEGGRSALLKELLALELEYRRGRGEDPSFNHYAALLPNDLSVLRTAWDEATDTEIDCEVPPLRIRGRQESVPGDFGDYELLRKLGEGGMGIVYEARQISLNRRVALKMIRAGEFAGQDVIRRFRNEAETVATLDHPGIVPILEIGQTGDQQFYTMKLVEGGSLAERLKSYLDDPRGAARLVAGVAEAVHHAHLRGVLHRDLKPGNILVDAEGRGHVTDFGLAKWAGRDSSLTRSGAIVGSPSYMAPEQAAGEHRRITTATDVYGLGAVLYALLSGRPPFVGDSILGTLDQVRDRAPDPLTRQNPRVPRDLEVICSKCLEKDPKRRYASAQALADDLSRWLSGQPINARPVSAASRAWMWCRRKPVLASLAAGLSLALVLGVLGIALEWRRAQANLALANKANTSLSIANSQLYNAQLSLRRTLYGANLNLIQNAWESNNVGRVRELLDQQQPAAGQPDPRGFEWHYWQRLSHTEQLTLEGHARAVSSVAYSPDGRVIASTDDGGILKLWDAATGGVIHSFQAHADPIRALAFGPDGWLATTSLDHRVNVWRTDSWQLPLSYQRHVKPVTCLAFSPDGRLIASGSWDKTVRVWDRETGIDQVIFTGHTDRVRSVAFSPDGRRIASAGFDKKVRVWDASTGNQILTLDDHSEPVGCVTFSPDGRRIASASLDRTARVWDAETGHSLLTLRGHDNWVHAVVYSPDGRQLATASKDQTVRIWNAETGDEIVVLKGHTAAVNTVAFNPNGRHVISGGADNALKIWDPVPARDAIILKGHTDRVRAVAFSPDGRYVLSAGDDAELRIWEADTGLAVGAPLRRTSGVHAVAFSPDGRLVFDGGGAEVRVWNFDTREVLQNLKVDRGDVLSLALSPDGRRLAIGGDANCVFVHDARTGVLQRSLEGHAGSVVGIAFSPDGRRIASVDDEHDLKVCDAETGDRLLSQQCDDGGGATGVAFGPAGLRIATSGRDQKVHIWNAMNGAELFRLTGHTATVESVAFSPDGRRIASSGGDNSVKLWDADTGNELLTLRGHTGFVGAVAFSPDGRRIASAGHDFTTRIWSSLPCPCGQQ